MDMKEFGTRLQAASAGMRGQLPAWNLAQDEKRKTNAALDEQRRMALLRDNRTGLQFLQANKPDQAMSLLQNRMDSILKLGGDPSDTAGIARLVSEGKYDEAISEMEILDRVAVSEGLLESMADEHIGNKGGQDIFRRPDGTTYAKPTEGWSAEAAAQSSDVAAPAAVREYEFYTKLTPEQKAEYREVKRQAQIVQLGGGAVGAYGGGQVTPVTTGQGQTVDQFRDEYSSAEANLDQAKAQASGLGDDAAAESTNAYQSYRSIQSSLGTYDKAIAAIDKGANSGRISSMFPTIKSSTVELENLRAKLGLDVVAASKFGALSEGELRLALEVAVPNLPGPELKNWLTQRKAAQQKLAEYYKGVAIYLGKKGNTLPKYLEEQEAALSQSPGSATQQADRGGFNEDVPAILAPKFLGFE